MSQENTIRSQDTERIPLEKRLRNIVGARRRFPLAINLSYGSFFSLVGEMTSFQEQYQTIQQGCSQRCGSPDEYSTLLYDLILQAQTLAPLDQEYLLTWTLVRPFAALKQWGDGQSIHQKGELP